MISIIILIALILIGLIAFIIGQIMAMKNREDNKENEGLEGQKECSNVSIEVRREVKNKKLINGTMIILLVVLGIYLYENWGLFGPKPTVLVVNSMPNRTPKLANATIKNKKDVQIMYRILVRAPKMPKGPISCPSDNGMAYKLTFKSRNTSTNMDVNAAGCEGVSIDGNKMKTLAGDQQSDEFWFLLSKDLNIAVKKLKKGNEQ